MRKCRCRRHCDCQTLRGIEKFENELKKSREETADVRDFFSGPEFELRWWLLGEMNDEEIEAALELQKNGKDWILPMMQTRHTRKTRRLPAWLYDA